MHEQLLIFVDRLKGGNSCTLDEVCATDFMDLHDSEITMGKTLSFKGQAYLAEHELIVHLDVETTVLMPCAICNEMVEVPLQLKGLYFNQDAGKIKNGIYSLAVPLREEVLLNLPRFVECGGHCPKREEYKKYFVSQEEEKEEN